MRQGSTGGQFHPLEDKDPRTVSSYRIAARLGAGGMGQVYLSYTPGGHPIAVKVIRPELGDDAGFRQRFRLEVQAAQRVQGLYTAPVIDFDTEDSRPWLATAYVPGPSLAVAVSEHGRLPVPAVLRLLAGMAEALKVIHAAGIVHRDLKPANVLLGADGPKVIDFGIARAADATALTGTGVTVGTPAFMSPEQAAGREIGPASDVFTLGQVGVYAALGATAHGEGNSHAVLYRIVHEEPDLTGLPEELGFLARCLAKDPAERPDPAEIIELCRAASPEPLSQQGSWLPEAMTEDIDRRTRAWAAMRTTTEADKGRDAAGAEEGAVAGEAAARAPGAGPGGVHHAPTRTAEATPPPVTAAPRAAAPTPPPGAPAPQAAAVPTPPPYPGTYPGMQPSGPATHPGPGAAHPTYPTQAQQPHSLHAAPYPVQPGPGWLPQPPPKKKMSGGAIALIVIAAVLLPVGGCAALLAGVATSSQNNKPGAAASGKGGTPRPDPKPVTYKGVNVPNDYYVRFADSPLKPVHSGDAGYEDDADFYYWSDERYLGSSSAQVVLLNNSQQGSLKTCRAETRFTERVTLGQAGPGTQFCVHTKSGHIALVTLKAKSGSSDPSDYVTLDFTLWRNAEEPDSSY
ncbi:serine/threonine-protein kinase [Streptomyces sp. NPDC004111]|uniref:serine/threonine-protein kinase n=1 Tax=Streptomyces sp. NPDC004111 TaxID=3364690 RepID=UPI00368F03A1